MKTSQKMDQQPLLSRWGFPLISYISMVLGLHIFHNAWAAFGFYHGLILLIMLTDRNRAFWKTLLAGWNWPLGMMAVVFGLGGGLVILLLAPSAGIDSQMIRPALSKLGLQGNSWLIFVFYHSLVNPWLEEVFWRGKLGTSNRLPQWDDLLFAGYHSLVLVLFFDWVWIILATFILTIAGWLWRQMKRTHDGLLMPVISHICADASIMAAIFFLNRGH